MHKLQALEPKKRINSIDILRGLALFGVLIVNLIFQFRISIFEQFVVEPFASLWWLDRVIERFVYYGFESKAVLVFSFLFGVGLAGFIALRIFGAQLGGPLLGLLGGLVSSTATTLTYARQAHENPNLERFSTTIIVLANLMVFARLGIVGLFVAPAMARPLLTIMGSGLAAGLIVAGLQGRNEHETSATPEIKNPTELKTAFAFALLYSIVLFCSAWLNDVAGRSGIYLVALATGLTDVDAISLSSLRLFNQGRLESHAAMIAIALAVAANTVFKLGLILSIGGGSFAKRCVPTLLAALLGMLASVMLLHS